MADTADVVFHDPTIDVGTHALVIGIGTYPFLAGGAMPRQYTAGLRQLTSPPVSAREVATWLRSTYCCPSKPLASLSLLISEAAPAPFDDPVAGKSSAIPAATIDAIVSAVEGWRQRGDSDGGNRLVFYFCGHGTSQGDDMALLAEDFDPDTGNPLDHALDFRKLYVGLDRCAASQQVFFVDACRSGSDLLISQSGGLFVGRVPILPGVRQHPERREAMTYYATLAGDLAYGRNNEVSLFTKAVLRAMVGAASDDPGDEWWVSTIQLHAAVSHFMKEPVFAGKLACVQVPAVKDMPAFDLHQLTSPPVVPVYVGCVPDVIGNDTAEFVCRLDGAERAKRTAAGADESDPDGRWLLDLPLGRYEFEARLGPNDVRRLTRDIRPMVKIVGLKGAP